MNIIVQPSTTSNNEHSWIASTNISSEQQWASTNKNEKQWTIIAWEEIIEEEKKRKEGEMEEDKKKQTGITPQTYKHQHKQQIIFSFWPQIALNFLNKNKNMQHEENWTLLSSRNQGVMNKKPSCKQWPHDAAFNFKP